MEPPIALTLAKEQTTQLITLATALIAISVTFAKDLPGGQTAGRERRLVAWGWGLLLGSVVFGIYTLAMLTHAYVHNPQATVEPLRQADVRVVAALQILSFLGGVVFLLLQAWRKATR